MEYQRPHSLSDPENIFSNRTESRTGNIKFPRTVPRPLVEAILNIHRIDPERTDSNSNSDIYSLYDRFNMTRPAHYLETHIDQFFRILFFVHELRISRIVDEEDIFDGPKPFILGSSIIDLLDDDDTYSQFLLDLKRLPEQLDKKILTKNPLFQRIISASIIHAKKI